MRRLNLSNRVSAFVCMISMALTPVFAQDGGNFAAPPTNPPAAAAEKIAVNSTCPECEGEVAALRVLEGELDTLRNQIRWKFWELDGHKAGIEQQQKKVKLAEGAANSQVGTGGSAYDPSTGLTTEAITQNDGRVKITVTDADGKVVSGPSYRVRKDIERMKQELEAEKAKLADLEKAQKKAQDELKRLQAKEPVAARRVGEARVRVQDCQKKCEVGHSGHSTALKVGLIAGGVAAAAALTYFSLKGNSNRMPAIADRLPGMAVPATSSTQVTPAAPPASQTTPAAPSSSGTLKNLLGNYAMTGEQVSNTGCSLLGRAISGTLILQGDPNGSTATLIEAGSLPLTFTGTIQSNGAFDMLTRGTVNGNDFNSRITGQFSNGQFQAAQDFTFAPGNHDPQCGAGAKVAYVISGHR